MTSKFLAYLFRDDKKGKFRHFSMCVILTLSLFVLGALVPCAEQSGITGAGNRTSAVPFQCLTELQPGDFVEVFVKNKTATTDIVCDNVNVIAIEL